MPLLERAGRGVRLTDAAIVLVGHAEVLLERAELAEAELAAAAGSVAGRARIASFQSVAIRLAGARDAALAARRLACAASWWRPSRSSRCPRSRSATSTSCWPTSGSTSRGAARRGRPRGPPPGPSPSRPPRGPSRRPAPPRRRPARRAGRRGVDHGPPRDRLGGGDERTCRELGGFDPDIRHRTNDSVISLALVAHGQAVTLLPEWWAPGAPGWSCGRSPRAVHRPDLRGHPRRGRRAALGAGAAGRRPHRDLRHAAAMSAEASGSWSRPPRVLGAAAAERGPCLDTHRSTCSR